MEELSIDQNKFQDNYLFVEGNVKTRGQFTIAFIVMSVIFFILAIAGTVFVIVKGRQQNAEYAEIEQ